MQTSAPTQPVVVEAASKPEAHWFYKTVSNKKEFLEYFESTYSYERLLRIHPVELRDICEEALEFAKYFRVELPDYVAGMVKDPNAFAEQALDRGIIPNYSDVTLLNAEQGTNYRNMLEYSEEISKYVKPVSETVHADPLQVIASEECIDDVDNYVQSLM